MSQEYKKCTDCKQNLPIINFNKYKKQKIDTKYYTRNRCSLCEKNKRLKTYQKNKNKYNNISRVYRQKSKKGAEKIIKKLSEKICKNCKKSSTVTKFGTTSYYTKQGKIIVYRSRCFVCTNLQHNYCRKNNIDKYRKKEKEYVLKNSSYIKQKHKI